MARIASAMMDPLSIDEVSLPSCARPSGSMTKPNLDRLAFSRGEVNWGKP